VQLVCVVTDDLTKSKPAGKIVGAVAKELGGGGGGKPHMATAGGKDIQQLDAVLSNIPTLVSTI
jgi:alanyl-tRNA synthetase